MEKKQNQISNELSLHQKKGKNVGAENESQAGQGSQKSAGEKMTVKKTLAVGKKQITSTTTIKKSVATRKVGSKRPLSKGKSI